MKFVGRYTLHFAIHMIYYNIDFISELCSSGDYYSDTFRIATTRASASHFLETKDWGGPKYKY